MRTFHVTVLALFLLAVVGLVVSSCREEPRLLTVHMARVSQIVYFQDPRTDLCFAAIASSNGYGHLLSFTNVSCSDKVWAQIKVFRQESRRYLNEKGE